MNRSFSVLAVLVVLLLTSCQQEPDDVILSPSPNTVDNSSYLKTIVSLDTSLPAGQDTSFVYHFLYDSQKRLVEIRGFDYETGLTEENEKRFYNGNDTLPYKVVFYLEETPPFADQIDTIYLTYQNGVIIKDSVIQYSGTQRHTPIVSYFRPLSANRWYISRYFQNPGGPVFKDSVVGNLTWANGNLISQKDTTFQPLLNQWSSSAQYDNHPNPFYRYTLAYPFVSVFFMTRYPLFDQRTRNNQTSLTVTSNGTLSSQAQINYQYRSDGYPVSMTISGLGDTLKDLYFYQKL
jgi:hypothetical protein